MKASMRGNEREEEQGDTYRWKTEPRTNRKELFVIAGAPTRRDKKREGRPGTRNIRKQKEK